MNLGIDIHPGEELRIARGQSAVNPSRVTVTLHQPNTDGKGRHLAASAGADVNSYETVEQVVVRLVRQVRRGADG